MLIICRTYFRCREIVSHVQPKHSRRQITFQETDNVTELVDTKIPLRCVHPNSVCMYFCMSGVDSGSYRTNTAAFDSRMSNLNRRNVTLNVSAGEKGWGRHFNHTYISAGGNGRVGSYLRCQTCIIYTRLMEVSHIAR